MCPTTIPIKSTQIVLPISTENPSSTHGRYGAWKFKIPKKFMRMNGFLRDQTYTNMIVNACPKNKRLTKNANIIIRMPPKKNIIIKSALLPRKDPSSSIRQYLYVKIMLKRKLNPNVPKNRNVVPSRHSW